MSGADRDASWRHGAAALALLVAGTSLALRWDLATQVTPAALRDPDSREGALDALLRTGDRQRDPEACGQALVELLDQPAWQQKAIAALGALGPSAGEDAATALADALSSLEGVALARGITALRSIAPQGQPTDEALRRYREHPNPLARMAAMPSSRG